MLGDITFVKIPELGATAGPELLYHLKLGPSLHSLLSWFQQGRETLQASSPLLALHEAVSSGLCWTFQVSAYLERTIEV